MVAGLAREDPTFAHDTAFRHFWEQPRPVQVARPAAVGSEPEWTVRDARLQFDDCMHLLVRRVAQARIGSHGPTLPTAVNDWVLSETLRFSLRILQSFPERRFVPYVVSKVDGGIELSWNTSGLDLDYEIFPDGERFLILRTADGIREEYDDPDAHFSDIHLHFKRAAADQPA